MQGFARSGESLPTFQTNPVAPEPDLQFGEACTMLGSTKETTSEICQFSNEASFHHDDTLQNLGSTSEAVHLEGKRF